MVGLIEAEVALEELQEIEELPPEVIFEGVAVIEHVGAAAKTSPIFIKKAEKTTKIDNMTSFNIFFFI